MDGVDKALQALLVNNPTLPGMMGFTTPQTRNVPMTFSPAEKLETWPAGEEGGSIPRPAALPMDKPGIEIPLNAPPNYGANPKNVLADYVSHIMTNPGQPGFDPRLMGLYQQYAQGLNPEIQRQRYQYEVENFGENRPYEQWLQASGAPAMMRGYVFDQWPEEANRGMNTPEQLGILQKIKEMLGL